MTERSSKVQARDEDKRRGIREKYRRLKEDVTGEHRQELIDPGNERNLLRQKLETADKYFNDVTTTREAALDSVCLVHISDLGKKSAQALKTDFVTFQPADFCEKVRVAVGGELDLQGNSNFSHDHWLQLGEALQSFLNKAPVVRFMCGSFDRGEVALKKVRSTRERDKDEDKASGRSTKLAELSSLQETDRGELTTAQVEHLLKTLWDIYEREDREPICFFEFVTHPHSFGQTVENIFYLSFLVRDGYARVFLGSDSLPAIEPIERGEDTNANSQSNSKQQVIMSLTPAEWKQIVTTFDISEPVIKNMKPRDVLHDHNPPLQEVNKAQSGKGKGKGKKSAIII